MAQPHLPAGFVLDQETGGVPPLPPGFSLDQPQAASEPKEKRNIRGELVGPSTFENVVKGAADFATGASSLMRGIGNIPGKAIDAVRGPKLDELVTGKQKGDTGYYGDFAFPKSTESGALKFAGELADPLAWTIGGGVAKALPYAKMGGQGLVKGLQAFGKNAGSGAVAGGTIGALSDEGSATTGAGFGALANTVIPPVFGGVARGVTAAKQALYPTPGALGVKAAGDKADDVITALTNTRSEVPGVNLTSGQASVPANSAEFAAFQKRVAQGKDPSGYFGATGIEGQQQAARLAAVQGVGKTPQELKAAELIRQISAKQNYGQAYQQAIKGDGQLMQMSQNPFFKEALKDANRLAQAEGISPKTDLTQFLHFVKVSLDKQLIKTGDTALANTEKRAVENIKNELVAWMGKKNPDYDKARQVFATQSKPINQMEVGQYLEQKLTNSLETGERAGVYAQALRDAPGTLKRATGQPRYDDLGQVLKPAQERALRSVGDDLSHNAEYEALASKGATNLENRIGAPEVPPTGWFQPMVSAARGWANRALGSGLEKGLEKSAQVMKNPQAMAQAMRSATPQQQAAMRSVIAEYLARTATIGGAQNDESAQKRSAYARALKE